MLFGNIGPQAFMYHLYSLALGKQVECQVNRLRTGSADNDIFAKFGRSNVIYLNEIDRSAGRKLAFSVSANCNNDDIGSFLLDQILVDFRVCYKLNPMHFLLSAQVRD